MGLENNIRTFALENAVHFDGRANPGAVIGKIIAENPEAKKDMKDISRQVHEIVAQVNAMSLDEQKAELEKRAPERLEKKKGEKHSLIELKNAEKGKVVTRIPPEPSKYAHIGHALSFLINWMYAEKYEGRCLVRFEDTNPSLARQEYVDAIKEDIAYLGIVPDEMRMVSEDMDKMYRFAEQLIEQNVAFVCECTREQMGELRHKGLPCEHRDAPVAQQMEKWQLMLDKKYKEGEAVLRLRGDMESQNQVMRDPVLFRVAYEQHYLHKDRYCVWPLYDFENAIEDATSGVTHILRSIEFGAMRVELQDKIKELLNLPKQTVVQYGRFNVVGASTQGREIREQMQQGTLTGWDDVRLVTIKALRRRGIQPEAFRELAINAGLSTTPTNIDWSMISAANRRILNASASRYFFVKEPEKITIKEAQPQDVEIPLHPDDEARGVRTFRTSDEFIVEKADAELMKKEVVRLMDCLNVRDGTLVSRSIDEFRAAKGRRIIHWLPADDAVDVEILMPDATMLKGKAERAATHIKDGDIVQFVRFGFCRKEGSHFVYCHE